MSIRQISVFLENRTGSLEEFTELIGSNGIDLIALSIADTTDFGILRIIVDDNEKALKLIQDNGYTANITEVLAVAVPDTPGGLARALQTLRAGDVTVEYLYSFVRRLHHSAILIFRVDKPQQAHSLLVEKGFEMIEETEINGTSKS